MDHHVTVHYLESLDPPRSHTPHTRPATTSTILHLQTLDDLHDPVAAEVESFQTSFDWQNSKIGHRALYRRGHDGRWWMRTEPGDDGTVESVADLLRNAGHLMFGHCASAEDAAVLAQRTLDDHAEDQAGQLWHAVPYEPYYVTEVTRDWSEVTLNHWNGPSPGKGSVGATEQSKDGLSGFDLAVQRARSTHLAVHGRINVRRPECFTHNVPGPRTVRVQVRLDVTLTLPEALSAEHALQQLSGKLGTRLGPDRAVKALDAVINLRLVDI